MNPQELFLKSVSSYMNNTSLSVEISKESFWHDLMKYSLEQKLLPIVFEILHESMPDSIRKQYRPIVMMQVARQTANTAEFLRLYNNLIQFGVQALVVKGIIVRNTYPLPDFRVSADEDLYILRNNYMNFHATMQRLGFSCTSSLDIDNSHEARYLRTDFMVEGHWELFPQEHALLNSLNQYSTEFWQHARTIIIDNIPILTLDPTDHMTFLLLHAFKHFIGSGFGIRQICDVVQWSKTNDVQWNRVYSVLSEVNAELFAAAIFGIGEEYFGMSYPPGWERTDFVPLLDDSLSAGIYGASTMSRKHSGTITLGTVDSKFSGSKHIPLLSSLFPRREVMEMNFPWVRHSILLLPLSWIIRIARYLKSTAIDNSPAESICIGKERSELLRFYKII